MTGTVTLEAKFFRAESGGSPLVAAKTYAVTLEDGVFQVNVALTPAEFHAVFPAVDTQAFIEITDKTNGRTYPRHSFSPVPYALKVPVDGLTASYDANGKLHVGPVAAAASGQFLTTDAGGQFIWATPVGGGSVADAINDGTTNAAPSQNAVFDALATKEPVLSAGATSQYLRGDKTWQTLSTASVPESGNLYFTNARAQSAAVSDAITDGQTNVAPSQNAVFDALALKAGSAHEHSSLDAADGNPVDALLVNANGDVGIGIPAPASRLDVMGLSDTTGIRHTYSGNTSYHVDLFVSNAGKATISSAGAVADILLLPAAGRFVGIGTATPARKLHVSEAMRLQPSTSPPASPALGDIYVDDSNAVCVYVDAAWAKLAGSGTCS